MSSTIDVETLRTQFPTLAHKTYLASGSYGLLALEVKAALERYLDDRLQHGVMWGEWAGHAEQVRARMATLLNASPGEIAITGSASAGINSLASALRYEKGRNKIVVSDSEFPTSGQIWHAQEQLGAVIEHVPEAADGQIPLEHFERAIDERTQLVAITHVCYRNGSLLDVEGIVRIAHRHGALVLLDCFQSVGAHHIDVKALDVDFAVGGMLKYLLGTAGLGFLYVNEKHVSSLIPAASGWFAQAAPDAMDHAHNVPAPDARRFQAGTPAVANCYAATAGLDIILRLGTRAIEASVRELTGHCMDQLSSEGFKVVTPRADRARGPMVAVRSNNAQALVEKLAEDNIVVSSRDGNVRAMFHVYNNAADVAKLVRALRANRTLLA